MAVSRPPDRLVNRRLPRSFFRRDPVACARDLVGCTLIWGDSAALIVETEAYAAHDDEACHTWSRPSAREFVEKHEAGSAYVYFNYGVHWMLNALVKDGIMDGFVLFRALEPLEGVADMIKRRSSRVGFVRPKSTTTWLCSGPGKLAQALGVSGKDHGRDFCDGDIGFLPRHEEVQIIEDSRVGISRAQHLQWRFLLADNAHWSVKPSLKK